MLIGNNILFIQLVKVQAWMNEGVAKKILDMDPDTQKLIIPMCTNTNDVKDVCFKEHWHLLIFDINILKWYHYSSYRIGEIWERVQKDAAEMVAFCEEPLSTWFATQNREVNLCRSSCKCSIEVPENIRWVVQKPRNPDSLLYVCYWMKNHCRASPSRIKRIDYGPVLETLMEKKRRAMAFKLLNASPPETSWGRFTNFEYRNNVEGGFCQEGSSQENDI